MTLLEQLQSHRGGLLHLKTQLCWYDGRGWDNNPSRICLLLDAEAAGATSAATDGFGRPGGGAATATAVALLLIDGQPQWIWVAGQDVEVIDEAG